MLCLIGFLHVWQPRQLWTSPALRGKDEFGRHHAAAETVAPRSEPDQAVRRAWMPWLILCIVDAALGHGQTQAPPERPLRAALSGRRAAQSGAEGAARRRRPAPEPAVFTFTFFSYTGTGILIAAIISGF